METDDAFSSAVGKKKFNEEERQLNEDKEQFKDNYDEDKFRGRSFAELGGRTITAPETKDSTTSNSKKVEKEVVGLSGGSLVRCGKPSYGL